MAKPIQTRGVTRIAQGLPVDGRFGFTLSARNLVSKVGGRRDVPQDGSGPHPRGDATRCRSWGGVAPRGDEGPRGPGVRTRLRWLRPQRRDLAGQSSGSDARGLVSVDGPEDVLVLVVDVVVVRRSDPVAVGCLLREADTRESGLE